MLKLLQRTSSCLATTSHRSPSTGTKQVLKVRPLRRTGAFNGATSTNSSDSTPSLVTVDQVLEHPARYLTSFFKQSLPIKSSITSTNTTTSTTETTGTTTTTNTMTEQIVQVWEQLPETFEPHGIHYHYMMCHYISQFDYKQVENSFHQAKSHLTLQCLHPKLFGHFFIALNKQHQFKETRQWFQYFTNLTPVEPRTPLATRVFDRNDQQETSTAPEQQPVSKSNDNDTITMGKESQIALPATVYHCAMVAAGHLKDAQFSIQVYELMQSNHIAMKGSTYFHLLTACVHDIKYHDMKQLHQYLRIMLAEKYPIARSIVPHIYLKCAKLSQLSNAPIADTLIQVPHVGGINMTSEFTYEICLQTLWKLKCIKEAVQLYSLVMSNDYNPMALKSRISKDLLNRSLLLENIKYEYISESFSIPTNTFAARSTATSAEGVGISAPSAASPLTSSTTDASDPLHPITHYILHAMEQHDIQCQHRSRILITCINGIYWY